jgi:hypothetical protein
VRSATWFKLLTGVLVCLATVVSVSSEENVHQLSVRLLDGTSGKPIAHFWITLGVPKDDKRANRWVDKTNSNGIVSFLLNDPIPNSIWPILANEVYLCSQVAFSTDQILQTGIVADNKCKDSRETRGVRKASEPVGKNEA